MVDNTPAPREPGQKIRVSNSTMKVFETLLDGSEARGHVRWNAFRRAMGELGFSEGRPKGVAWTFLPPESAPFLCNKSFSIHKPHNDKIEGPAMRRVYKRKLKEVFGWDMDTFERE